MARGHIRPARSAAGRAGKAWVVVVTLPPDALSRRQQQSVTTYGTRRDAERELTRRQREVDTGRLAARGSVSTGEYLDGWLAEARLRVAYQTAHGYQSAVAAWKAHLGGVRLDRLSRAQVQAAVLAPGTVRQRVNVLRGALRVAVETGVIGRNPCDGVTLPRQDPAPKRSLTPEEAVRLLAAARQDRAGLHVILALALGLRLGEVEALAWADVDLEAGAARVWRSRQRNGELKGTKSGRERRVAIPEFARLALRETARAGEFVCPSHICTTEIMRRLCRAAGIEPAITFHELRHTHATLLLASGADLKAVSERLGHANTTITLQVYHHVLPGADAELAARLGRVLG